MTDPTDLRALLDEREIVATAIRYTWALDAKRWDDLDQVFTEDATANLTEPVSGRTAIKARVAAALGPLDDSQHLVGNHEVELDGDRATHRCYLHAQHIRHGVDDSPLFVVAGRYEDDMVRTEAGWRIAHRSLIVMWTDGNTDVVRPPSSSTDR